MGVSQSRNTGLASVFYRMKIIESYGTGIGKIQRLYNDSGMKPVCETAKAVFRVTLPNRNEGVKSKVAIDMQMEKIELSDLRKQKQIILEFATENGQIIRKDVEELLGAKTTKAFRLLKELCKEGKLKAYGSGKLIKYKPL